MGWVQRGRARGSDPSAPNSSPTSTCSPSSTSASMVAPPPTRCAPTRIWPRTRNRLGRRPDRAGHGRGRSLRPHGAQPPGVRRGDDRRVDHRHGRACRSTRAPRATSWPSCWPTPAVAAWSAADSSLEQVAMARTQGPASTGCWPSRPARTRRGTASTRCERRRGVEPIARCATPGPDRRRAPRARRSDPLQIIYTSGTTGDPKGVVFTNDRFGIFAMVGHPLRLPGGRAALHGTVAHPRQRAGGHPGPVAGHGPAGGVQPPVHQVEAVGRVPGPRLHDVLPPRRHGHRGLQRTAAARRRRQPGALRDLRRHAGRDLGGRSSSASIVRDPRVVRRGRGRTGREADRPGPDRAPSASRSPVSR